MAGGSRRSDEDSPLRRGSPTTLSPKVGSLGLPNPKKRGVGVTGPSVKGSRKNDEDNRLDMASSFIGHKCHFENSQYAKVDVKPHLVSIAPQLDHGTPDRAKRGLIGPFTVKSRRRFQWKMASVDENARCFTCILTMPGNNYLPYDHRELFHEGMAKLRKAWPSKFPGVGAFWKREPQKRGAMHAHLLIYFGDDDSPETLRKFQDWLFHKWHDLVGCGDKHHLSNHLRGFRRKGRTDPNFREVDNTNFSQYMAKYLGKDDDCEEIEHEGRWWGMINKAAIPFGEEVRHTISGREGATLARWARKLRDRRAAQAKLKFLLKRSDLPTDFLTLGEWTTVRSTGRLVRSEFTQQKSKDAGAFILETLGNAARVSSQGIGDPRLPRGGAVTLSFHKAPEIVDRMWQYIEQELSTVAVAARWMFREQLFIQQPNVSLEIHGAPSMVTGEPPGRKASYTIENVGPGEPVAYLEEKWEKFEDLHKLIASRGYDWSILDFGHMRSGGSYTIPSETVELDNGTRPIP